MQRHEDNGEIGEAMLNRFGISSGVAALFVTVIAMVIGQASIFAILPPLGRELGFSELQTGIVVTASSFVAFLVSPWWGRRVNSYGPRLVALIGLSGGFVCFVSMALFADMGLREAVSSEVVFWLILIVRGGLLGLFLAAVLVAVYAAVAGFSTEENDRVAGFATVQAAYSLGNILGPLIGGLLAGFGFVLALALTPLFTVVGIIAVAVLLPRHMGGSVAGPTPQLKARDPRVFPLLCVMFCVATPLAVTMITLGFLVQDRLVLDPITTARTAGFAAFTVFATFFMTQITVVKVLKWPALRLVRTGTIFSFVGMIGLSLGGTALILFASMAVLGVGIGMSQTGAMTMPTLAVEPHEQGAVSGLIIATSTLAFTIGPAGAGWLYGFNSALPFVVSAVLLAGVRVFVEVSRYPSLNAPVHAEK